MPIRPPNPWNVYWRSLPKGFFLFPEEGEEAARNLVAALRPTPSDVVLDYGCGYGQAALFLAPRVGTLYLWDYDEQMRAFAADYLRGLPNVVPWTPDDAGVSFDLIWLNSVVQYMTAEQFAAVLQRCAAAVRPTGRVVVSDLIPPGLPTRSDLLSLARFSLQRGYFWRAFRKSLAVRRRYSALSDAAPLYHPARDEVVRLSAAAGLRADYLPKNLTHFRGRETAVLTRATA